MWELPVSMWRAVWACGLPPVRSVPAIFLKFDSDRRGPMRGEPQSNEQ